MKPIKPVIGLAFGISLICASQLLHQHTQKKFLKLVNYKPIQIILDKDSSHTSKDFYPEFDAVYELVLMRSSTKENDNKIISPAIKIQIIRSNQKFDVYTDAENSCDSSVCYLGSFSGVAKQKHTITIYVTSVNHKLYDLSPSIDSRVSAMYAAEGFKVLEDLAAFFLLVVGSLISIIDILVLTNKKSI